MAGGQDLHGLGAPILTGRLRLSLTGREGSRPHGHGAPSSLLHFLPGQREEGRTPPRMLASLCRGLRDTGTGRSRPGYSLFQTQQPTSGHTTKRNPCIWAETASLKTKRTGGSPGGGAGLPGAQSGEHPASALVTISRFGSSSPALGSVLPAPSLELLRILCLPLSLRLPHTCSVSPSLSKMNKH